MSGAVAAPAPTGLRASLVPFGTFGAVYFAHIGFFSPYLPLWLKSLGLSVAAIGLLASVQSATRLFAPYAWGMVSDRTGERVRLMRLGAALALLASFGLWIGGSPWWLALVLLLTFTNTSAMMSMSEAAMAQRVSAGGVFDARRYGRVRVWGSAGFLGMVLGAGLLFDHIGLGAFPVITSASLLAVLLCACWLPDQREPRQADAVHTPVAPVLRRPAVRWFFAAAFFHILAHMGIYTFLSLYLDAQGYGKGLIGLLWAVSVLAEVLFFLFQGRWFGRLSLGAWLVLCSLAMVLRMGAIAAAPQALALLVLAQVLHALTFAGHHAACIAMVSQHFPDRLRARGQALYTVVGYGLPGVIGGTLGGQLSQHLGLGAVFWACCAISLLAAGCGVRVWRLAASDAAATAGSR